jgi:hypothetical protein
VETCQPTNPRRQQLTRQRSGRYGQNGHDDCADRSGGCGGGFFAPPTPCHNSPRSSEATPNRLTARQRQHDWPNARKVLKPHLNRQFVIPPEANAAFVANMEDELEVITSPTPAALRVSLGCSVAFNVTLSRRWHVRRVSDLRPASIDE